MIELPSAHTWLTPYKMSKTTVATPSVTSGAGHELENVNFRQEVRDAILIRPQRMEVKIIENIKRETEAKCGENNQAFLKHTAEWLTIPVPQKLQTEGRYQKSKKVVKKKCNDCGKFVSVKRLKGHMNNRCESRWSVDLKDKPEDPRRCTKCGRTYKGHPVSKNSNCKLIGVNEEGMKKLLEKSEFSKKNKNRRQQIYEERLQLQKCFLMPSFKKLACDVCEIYEFNSPVGVFNHIQRKHGPKIHHICKEVGCNEMCLLGEKNNKKKLKYKYIYTCDECGKSFQSNTNMIIHKSRKHSSEENGEKRDNQKAIMLKHFEEDCKCSIDLRAQSQLVKLNHYKLVHLGYEQCKYCNKLFQAARKHSCGMLKKPLKKKCLYICKDCNFTFKTKQSLDNHMVENHKTEEKIGCTLCPKYFSKHYLKSHMTRGAHRIKKACSVCGKSVSKLKDHMETLHRNDSEKRFQCDQCSKGFWHTGQLRNHKMNIHLKLKPYSCRFECSQSYNDKSNRNQHEKRAHT